jgi:O-methyltransferase involved in polyketide biosynthesis
MRLRVFWKRHFNTRACRLPAAQKVNTIEVDQPETSLAKQATLRTVIGSLPNEVRFVTIDFNKQSVSDALHSAAFDERRPTVFRLGGRHQLFIS